jgi:Spx/MgsR family transcriptional regulator
MKEVVMYGYSKCSTCRNARKWLEAGGVKVTFKDIVEHPPGAAEITRWVALSGLPLDKFFNTSGEVYREMKLKDKLSTLSPDDKINLLSGNGKLIKRPVVTDDEQVTVGFQEAAYRSVWLGEQGASTAERK